MQGCSGVTIIGRGLEGGGEKLPEREELSGVSGGVKSPLILLVLCLCHFFVCVGFLPLVDVSFPVNCLSALGSLFNSICPLSCCFSLSCNFCSSFNLQSLLSAEAVFESADTLAVTMLGESFEGPAAAVENEDSAGVVDIWESFDLCEGALVVVRSSGPGKKVFAIDAARLL